MFEKTYTISQFLQKLNGEDKGSNYKKAVVSMATTAFLVNYPSIAFADGIDDLGNMFLTVARRLGYFIILTCAIVEIIKMAPSGADKEDIIKVIIKYVLLYAALFLIPRCFDIIAKTLG